MTRTTIIVEIEVEHHPSVSKDELMEVVRSLNFYHFHYGTFMYDSDNNKVAQIVKIQTDCEY